MEIKALNTKADTAKILGIGRTRLNTMVKNGDIKMSGEFIPKSEIDKILGESHNADTQIETSNTGLSRAEIVALVRETLQDAGAYTSFAPPAQPKTRQRRDRDVAINSGEIGAVQPMALNLIQIQTMHNLPIELLIDWIKRGMPYVCIAGRVAIESMNKCPESIYVQTGDVLTWIDKSKETELPDEDDFLNNDKEIAPETPEPITWIEMPITLTAPIISIAEETKMIEEKEQLAIEEKRKEAPLWSSDMPINDLNDIVKKYNEAPFIIADIYKCYQLAKQHNDGHAEMTEYIQAFIFVWAGYSGSITADINGEIVRAETHNVIADLKPITKILLQYSDNAPFDKAPDEIRKYFEYESPIVLTKDFIRDIHIANINYLRKTKNGK